MFKLGKIIQNRVNKLWKYIKQKFVINKYTNIKRQIRDSLNFNYLML